MLRRHAMPAPAVIDGHVIAGASSWELGEEEARGLDELATLKVKEYILDSPPGLPEVPRVLVAALDWAALEASEEKALLKRIMRRPGDKTLVLWREEHLTYLSDGTRKAFTLPNGWICAADVTPLPPGLSDDRFEAEFRLSAAGEPLPLTVQESSDFAAGDPSPGEVWRERGTGAWKLGQAPEKGVRIYVDVVPVYRMKRLKDDSRRRLEQSVVEPVRLQLRESP